MGGGRKNQAQRTKNNAKPSSSSRSADLLGSDATKLVGLVTLRQNQLFNVKSSTDSDLESVDPHFQVALKKLSKKDAITKQKGLAELCELCADAGQEGCKSILGAWARVYVTLSQDADNKVRERAQATQRAVARAAGRTIAPHLRTLFPSWLLAQFDSYPPAASIAASALTEMFPKNKLKDAILFCKQEIFSCISDNLMNQTPQTLSKSETSKEDMETKYERVILCSLLGYVQYIEVLAAADADEFVTTNKPLISSQKFSRIASFKAPQVRGAWCSTLVALCKCAPALVCEEARGLGSAVFAALDEPDPSALPQVWEAALHTLLVLKEGSDKAQLEKIIFPKVCNVLEKGGQGNAAAVYPNLLPFLSSFYDFASDKREFFDTFFNALQTGLYQPTVKLSAIESEAIVKTFFECLRFVILHHKEDSDFCLHLLNSQLIAVLGKVISDPSLAAMSDTYLWGVAEVASFWGRSSIVEQRNLTEKMWPLLAEVCLTALQDSLTDPPRARHVLSCHARFLESFFRPAPRPRRNLRVKFVGSDDVTMAELDKSTVEVDEVVMEPLKQLWQCLAEKQWCTADTACPAVRAAAAQALASGAQLLGWPTGTVPQGKEVCSKLQQWISNDSTATRQFLSVTFAILPTLDTNADGLLAHLAEEHPESMLSEAVSLVLKGPLGHMSKLTEWLQGRDAHFAQLSLLATRSSTSLDALKKCLSVTQQGEFVIGSQNAIDILKAVQDIIESEENSTDEQAVEWAAELAKAAWNPQAKSFFKQYSECAAALLEALLHRRLRRPLETHVASAWRSGAECLALEMHSYIVEQLLNDCAKAVGDLISSGEDDWLGVISEKRVAVVIDVLQTLGRDKMVETADQLMSYLYECCLSPWQDKLENAARKGLCLRGYLEVQGSGNDGTKVVGTWDPLSNARIDAYAAGALFSAWLLSAIFGKDGLLSEEQIPHFTQHVSHLVFASCLTENLQAFYSSTEQCFKSKELINNLLPVICELTSKFSPTNRNQIVSSIASRDSISNLLTWRDNDDLVCSLFSEITIEDVQSARIATEGLEEESLRALRKKLVCKAKEMQTHISFTCWKITTTCKHESTVLFGKQLNSAGASELLLSAETARLLVEIVRYDTNRVEPKTWDFLLVATASWIESLSLTTTPFHYVEFVSFVSAVCELHTLLTGILNGDERFAHLTKEWADLFAVSSSLSLLNSWKRLADECSTNKGDPVVLYHIESLSNAVRHIFNSGDLPTALSSSIDLKIWVRDCSKLLLSACPAVSITAFQILMSLASSLVKCDADLNEDKLDKLSINELQESLVKTQTIVSTMLQGIKLGVACLVEPFTDSYIYTRAYLFVWLVIVELFRLASAEARHLYTLSIKESELLEELLGALLRLLPEKVLGERGSPIAPELSARLSQELFLSAPPLIYSSWSSTWLGSLACWTYWQVLRWLPLLARRWYGGADGVARDLADRVTSRYVTPALVQEEIAYARSNARAHDQLAVDCVGSAGGLVTATYSLEDSKVQLGIALGQNHPFTPPRLDTSRSCVAGQANHKLRQLALLPTLQNATVWDCIMTWKNYLDKKFEGVEDCYICYSVLAPGTQQLPNFTCRTCRKKFHQSCLYKWFTSSSKSTCPICRNLF